MAIQKGNIPWNKGLTKEDTPQLSRPKPEAMKQKMRQIMKGKQNCLGRVLSEETRKKISKAHKGMKKPWAYQLPPMYGADNPNWKGGVTSADRLERVKFRDTMQKTILERDGYKCLICKKGGDLQVEHIAKWSKHPELRFIPANCVTLCKECHYQRTFGRPMSDPNMPWGHNLGRRVVS